VNDKSEMLQSPITPTDPRGDLIRSASAIIWDEAPMANRAVLACVEEVCRNVMGNTNPFGGKIVILLGDFRQTCPVIRGGTRPEIIDASIKSSPLWPLFKVFCLHAPIRNAQDLELASFVDEIGDGAGPEVSLNMLPSVTNIENLIDFIYPPNIITDPIACLKRAILCPTNAQVDNYNHIVTSHVEGTQHTYLAADSLQEANDIGLIPPDSVLDYFASHTPPGLPSHSLTIKVNAIYRLIRNFSIDLALVKNSRVIVIDVGARLITVRILRELANGTSVDADDILIPRISFTHTLRSGHTLLRRQFPLSPAYATTFNSCQGLTLDRIGIDLTTPVFSHGQLYTAMSRIRH